VKILFVEKSKTHEKRNKEKERRTMRSGFTGTSSAENG
jgi:hypothetical protein